MLKKEYIFQNSFFAFLLTCSQIEPCFHRNLSVPTGWLSPITRPENHIMCVKERFRDIAVVERLVFSDPGLTETLVYDEQDNRLISKTISGTDVDQTYVFHHKETADKSLESISVDGNTVKPETDALGRNVGKTVAFGDTKLIEKISYVKFGDHATNLPASIRFGIDDEFKDTLQYKYDGMGNIIAILENGRVICRYEYDALGRLTRKDNVTFGKTKTWTYDNNGNVIASYEYAITMSPTNDLSLRDVISTFYSYANNSDRLISYNNEKTGFAGFEYDEIGNPTVYRGKLASWGNGRQMVAFDGHTFAYDARGRRTRKDNITFTYDSDGNLIKQSNGLEFLYDHTGVFAVKYDNATYYYRKDAQGNVIALLDNTGAIVVKYVYDAWGNCLTTVLDIHATGIANLNPFRYRGYYYDVETKLYFLKTRYYDPEIGRFLTIDDVSYLDPESINGLNLYAYCGNNPVMLTDRYGCTAWWEWLIAGTIVAGLIVGSIFSGGFVGAAYVGAAIGAGISLGSQAVFDKELNWWQFVLDIEVGAITGFLGASTISVVGSIVAGTGLGGASNLASQLISGASLSQINWLSVGISALIGGISSVFSNGGARNPVSINKSPEVQAARKSLALVQRRISSGSYYATTRGMKSALTQAQNRLNRAIEHRVTELFTKSMLIYGIGTSIDKIVAWGIKQLRC